MIFHSKKKWLFDDKGGPLRALTEEESVLRKSFLKADRLEKQNGGIKHGKSETNFAFTETFE